MIQKKNPGRVPIHADAAGRQKAMRDNRLTAGMVPVSGWLSKDAGLALAAHCKRTGQDKNAAINEAVLRLAEK